VAKLTKTSKIILTGFFSSVFITFIIGAVFLTSEPNNNRQQNCSCLVIYSDTINREDLKHVNKDNVAESNAINFCIIAKESLERGGYEISYADVICQ
jgi:hypothetical protein